MSKVLKFVLFTVLGFGVLVVGLLITLRLMFPKDKIIAMTLPVISKTLNREVIIEDVGFSVFPNLSIRLENMQIANDTAAGFSQDKPWLKLESFRFELSWKSLLMMQLVINEILLVQPEMWIEINPAGHFNFESMGGVADTMDSLVASDPSASVSLPAGITLTLESFQIRQGQLTYYDQTVNQTVVLGNINEQTQVKSDAEFKDINLNGQVEIQKIRIIDRTIPQDIPELRITLLHDIHINMPSKEIQIRKIRACLQKFCIDLRGSIRNYETLPEYDLTLSTDTLSLNDIIHEIPPSLFPDISKIIARGKFSLNTRISGTIDTLNPGAMPTLRGKIVLTDGAISYQGFPKAIDALSLMVDFTEDEINLHNTRIKSGMDSISFRFRMTHFAKPLIDCELVADVSLDQLKNMMPMPKGFDINGRINTQLSVTGELDTFNYQKLNLQGQTRLQGVRLLTPELPDLMELEGNLAFSNSLIQIKPMIIKLGASDMTLALSIRNYLEPLLADHPILKNPVLIEGSLTSSYLDLDKIMNHLIAMDSLAGDSAAQAEPDLDQPFAIPELIPITLAFKGDCKKIRYFNLDCTSFSSRVSFQNQTLKQTAVAQLYEGSLNQELELELRSDSAVKLQLIMNTSKVEANDFISRLNDLAPEDLKLFQQLKNTDSVLYGKSDIRAKFETQGKTLREIRKNLIGRARIDVRQGRIEKNRLLETVYASAGKIDEILNKVGYDKLLFKQPRMEFREMYSELLIQDEKVIMDEFRTQTAQGDWRLTGYAAFSGELNLTIANKLNQDYSQKITSLENKGKEGLQQILKSVGAEKVTGLTDRIGIPKDKNGRVTFNVGITGTADQLGGEWRGFGSVDDTSIPVSNTAPAAVTDSLKKDVAQKILMAQDSLKKRLEEEARIKLEEEKKKIQDQIRKKFKF